MIYTNQTTPVALLSLDDDVKPFLRVNHSKDDTLIKALIRAATTFGEKYTGRAFVPRTVQGLFECLESSTHEAYPFITLRRSPLILVSSVEVFTGGAWVAFTGYQIKFKSGFSRILFTTTPTVDTDVAQPIRITFDAGYGTVVTPDTKATKVDELIKEAVRHHIAYLYENKGDAVADGKVPMPLETQLIYGSSYRIVDTYA